MNISATRINRWESCRLAYKFHYIDMMPQGRADHLELGTVVHSALEKVGKMLAEGKQVMTIDGLNAYKEAYQHSGLSGLTLFGEGQAMVGQYLDAQNPWPTVNHAELGFSISIPGTEHQLTGFIDRVDLTERGLEVIDYKTGRLIPTYAEVNASLQLRLYAAALRSLNGPQKAWPARLVLLRHGIEQTVTYTDRDLDEALDYAAVTATQIELAKEYPANVGAACANCPFRTNCHAYIDATKQSAEAWGKDLVMGDLDATAKERERLAGVIKALTARKDELEEAIRVELENVPEVYAGGMRYRFSQVASVSYPGPQVVELLQRAAGHDVTWDVVSVDKSKVEAMAKELKKSLPEKEAWALEVSLEDLAETRYSSRFTATKAKQ